ncbi:MAG TPA: NnrS family protein, partial [Burkholderiaceae bacterium]
ASLAFVAANVVVVRRQRAAHTVLLLAAAVCWAVGNTGFAGGANADAVAAWWFAFLVMTVAAERLEMARLMRHDARSQRRLVGALAALVAGAALSLPSPVAGGVLYGAALLALALWLGRYDIARRTIHAEGLPRYMAACLLSGYAWLGLAGVAWAATALGAPARDAALHALGLGFVIAMMMGHAPVILPAVAGIKVQYGPFLYAPLALLQASLLLRLGPGAFDPAWRAAGAALNAAALALFVLSIAGGAIVWRRHERAAISTSGRIPR